MVDIKQVDISKKQALAFKLFYETNFHLKTYLENMLYARKATQ